MADWTEHLFSVEHADPEYDLMWRRMFGMKPNSGGVPPKDSTCPYCHEGECWQYMGSVIRWNSTVKEEHRRHYAVARYFHQFRHRNFPGEGRVYLNVPADPTWEPKELR